MEVFGGDSRICFYLARASRYIKTLCYNISGVWCVLCEFCCFVVGSGVLVLAASVLLSRTHSGGCGAFGTLRVRGLVRVGVGLFCF